MSALDRHLVTTATGSDSRVRFCPLPTGTPHEPYRQSRRRPIDDEILAKAAYRALGREPVPRLRPPDEVPRRAVRG